MADSSSTGFGPFWPVITNENQARKAVRVAFWASIASALITIFLTFSGVMAYETYIDAGLFLIYSFGLWYNSRVASVCALFHFTSSKVLLLSVDPISIVAIAFFFFYVNGVRGALAYHALRKSSKP